jgi:hypothetical protein
MLLTLTALVTIGGGVFAEALLQQQASAAVVTVAGHNKCILSNII